MLCSADDLTLKDGRGGDLPSITRDAVARRYRREIETFGYEF